jgi:hypothetical protein
MGIAAAGGRRSGGGVAGVGLQDAGEDVALDEAALAASDLAEGGRGEAIDVAHGAGGGLVEQGDGILGEELAVTAGAAEAEVFGGVVGDQGPTLRRRLLREQRERFRRRARRSWSAGSPTRMSERSGRESHS